MKIIIKELLNLKNMIKSHIRYICNLGEIIIVYENLNFILIIFEVMLAGFKNFSISQKFSILSFVSSFR